MRARCAILASLLLPWLDAAGAAVDSKQTQCPNKVKYKHELLSSGINDSMPQIPRAYTIYPSHIFFPID
jgi:hypothetical protein